LVSVFDPHAARINVNAKSVNIFFMSQLLIV